MISTSTAPASLALTSTLMTQLSSKVVRTHLAIFSLAAPISAIITYTVLTWFDGMFDVRGGWTGKALLFSVRGMFLFIIMWDSNVNVHARMADLGRNLPLRCNPIVAHLSTRTRRRGGYNRCQAFTLDSSCHYCERHDGSSSGGWHGGTRTLTKNIRH